MKNIIATFAVIFILTIIIAGTTTQKDNPLLDQLPLGKCRSGHKSDPDSICK
jgi:hypothetical protein